MPGKKRHPNPRLAKIHRSYSVEEVAILYHVHKNTVRNWIKRGLPTVDNHRPMLILGKALAEFLRARRTKHKHVCKPDEMYCVRCRVPRKPAGEMAEYIPITETMGRLVGICPACDVLMNRRTSLAKLDEIRRLLEVTLPKGQQHINECAEPFVNSDLK